MQPAHRPLATAEDLAEVRKLVITNLWFSGLAFFFALVAAATATWTAVTIYRIIDGIASALERAGF